ncbi:MAG: ABC transporter ATP-binding protein [Caulobacteraceae bacterium]|nr:ABC transporter ATP-binding protein [Caulobacteraceae bacterium]
MAGVRLEGLNLAYGRTLAVSGLTGAFGPGVHAIVGPNGSGKSTLLKAIAGLIAPCAGRVVLEGAGRADIAYLPQDGGVQRDFPIEVADFVALGFEPRLGLFKGVGAADRAALGEALARVGLEGLARRPISALSGGQFQRAMFARVMVQQAKVVLLDEPFTALDTATAEDLTAIVRAWAQEDGCVIMVQHDLAVVRELCASALVLAGRPVAWGSIESVLTDDVLTQARRMARDATLSEAAP